MFTFLFIINLTEIIKEVKMEGNRLTELLQVSIEDLESDCLKRALLAAVDTGNHTNVGKLIVKGASNISEALKRSVEKKKHSVTAVLLLAVASIQGNRNQIKVLFGEAVDSFPRVENQEITAEDAQKIQEAVSSGKVSTVVSIEMAHRHQQNTVLEELLLHTDVSEKQGVVFWHGLRLLYLELSWISRVFWVKHLRLDRNGLKNVPSEVGQYLRQVVKLELQCNELTSIPGCIFQLPCLTELNLSYNKLLKLPEVDKWSIGLTSLDLSFNQLSGFPEKIEAPSIRTISISNNRFTNVPAAICTFSHLQNLDLSENTGILYLPVEMGRLSHLNILKLKGLKDLNDPPRNLQRDARDCIRYLNSKWRDAKKFFRMKLMLVGKQNRGKTTLVARLHGVNLKKDQSTVGIEVSDWSYGGITRNKFYFSIWDFGGQEEYYATHQCFLSDRSMYILVWNILHGEEGVRELEPWLNNIALRAPHSCVLIVGTHLDQVKETDRPDVDRLLCQIGKIANDYPRLCIAEVMPVGLKNRLENINRLREAIYKCAAEGNRGCQPIMGQEVPASYLRLNQELEKLQSLVRAGKMEPIIHAEEFKSLVQRLDIPDIQDQEELKTATLFLTEVGTILHYDDRSQNLNELYFIDPRWLCDMMSKIVTVPQLNPFIVNGILLSRYLPFLFKDERFPWQYFEQYIMLLDRFEIALPLDSKHILIPSMLPDERPAEAEVFDDLSGPPYERSLVFYAATPPGFWSRFLTRIMHTISCVCLALDYLTMAVDSTDRPRTGSGSSPAQVPDLILPSVRQSACQSHTTDIDPSTLHLVYWQKGLAYKGPDVSFTVESCFFTSKRGGVRIRTSPSDEGLKIICQLVDLVKSLMQDWYPGLIETVHKDEMEQIVPCYECLKLNRSLPFEFFVTKSSITCTDESVLCGYDQDLPRNHMVPRKLIAPELFLYDLDTKFHLKEGDFQDSDSLLGRGGYGNVFHGQYKGKSVAIKKYVCNLEDSFKELRSEAMMLQNLHHPCLVCLVGVCLQPYALILEEAPLGSLKSHIIVENPIPIPRLVIFRIATQVAAALRFLHSRGVIFRDLKSSNVLLWSLDSKALCHCKVTDFGLATTQSPIGALGVEGTKRFIAPEVLYPGHRRAVYTHKADIFSFAMFLYQLVTCRHPYHNVDDVKIDIKVLAKERPSIVDVPEAEAKYVYMIQLMEQCWRDNPDERPSTDEIINSTCSLPMQLVMTACRVKSQLSLRCCCAYPIISDKPGRTSSGDLWVCCDGAEGFEISIYNTNTMVQHCIPPTRYNQVQCMCVCKDVDQVWVASRSGIEYGVIDLFSTKTQEAVHRIRLKENSVTCMACSNCEVYIGTMEGYCLSFTANKTQTYRKPKHKYISEHPIDGIVVAGKHLWASHTTQLFFLDLGSLTIDHAWHRQTNKRAYVGTLHLSPDCKTVYSAHLGGTVVSAWNAQTEAHKYDIDTREVFERAGLSVNKDAVLTAMTPACDNVWVGLSSGHIAVLHGREVLWFVQPYAKFIRFLCTVPSCDLDSAMVVSGGKEFRSLHPKYSVKFDPTTNKQNAGVLVVWEAHSSSTMRKMRCIAEDGGKYLRSHRKLAKMIHTLGFKDPTQVLTNVTAKSPQTPTILLPNPDSKLPDAGSQADSHPKLSSPQVERVIDIDIQGEVIRMSCPHLVTLSGILDELEKMSPQGLLHSGCLSYTASDSGMLMKIVTEEDLQQLLSMEAHPCLTLTPV